MFKKQRKSLRLVTMLPLSLLALTVTPCHASPSFLLEQVAQIGDFFGWAVATGDFDGDGYDDLVVSSPGEKVNGESSAGIVNVMYSNSNGIKPVRYTNNIGEVQLWSQDSGAIEGNANNNDKFGTALAVGDFDGNGCDDLAIGVPGEDVDGANAAGAVNVLYGCQTITSQGLSAYQDQLWHQNTADIGGAAKANDSFGAALASGDFNHDGYDDLAIGVPGEDVGSVNTAGAVNIIYGSPSGLTATGNQLWHQDSSGIRDAAEAGDKFGYALAVGDFDGDSYDDLAVGVPGEDVGSPEMSNAGEVHVIYGGSGGLSAAGDQLWTQDTEDMKGAAEANDAFGSAVATGDFNSDGYADLVVGVPGEDIGSVNAAGAIAIIYGTSSGLSADRNQSWHQDSAGVEDTAESGDNFGAALAVGDFNGNGRDGLIVGVPGESWEAWEVQNIGAINIFPNPGTSSVLSSAENLRHFGGYYDFNGHESWDRFGFSMATGDFNGDGRDVFVVGAPYKDMDDLFADAGYPLPERYYYSWGPMEPHPEVYLDFYQQYYQGHGQVSVLRLVPDDIPVFDGLWSQQWWLTE